MGKETRLCVGLLFNKANVRKEFKIENILNHERLLGLRRPGMNMLGEPGKGIRLCQNLKTFSLHKRLIDNAIIGVITRRAKNQITDVLICLYTEGPEENPKRNLCLDAGHCRLQEKNL